MNREPTGFGFIENMQEMTSSICNIVSIGTSGTMRDIRDNKVYWVEKLEDGNCWMTENLDYDLKITQTLTSADSDVREDWTPPENTQISTNPDFGTTNNNIKSWDPALGKMPTYCNSGTAETAGKCKQNNNPTITANDYHDAQGNYYTYNAVTAGTGARVTDDGIRASGSICPKGWQLPENQRSTAGSNVLKSYRNLLDSYGWTWNQGNDPTKYSNSLTAIKNGVTYNIAQTPLYFVYGGYVNSSSLNGAGSYGYYWSSMVTGADGAYSLDISSAVNPSSNSGRHNGFSVRCVAR